MPGVIIDALGCPELVTLLVDGVVRQVHEEVVEGTFVAVDLQRFKFVRGKSNESFLVQENLEGLTA